MSHRSSKKARKKARKERRAQARAELDEMLKRIDYPPDFPFLQPKDFGYFCSGADLGEPTKYVVDTRPLTRSRLRKLAGLDDE